MTLQDQILNATLGLFNEKGIKFTMDELAKVLGISKKTLYLAFSDKEAILMAMLQAGFQEIKKSEEVIYEDKEMPLLEKIRRIIIVLPERYQAVDFRQLYELEDKYPKVYQKVEEKLESDWDKTVALLEEAMEKGLIKRIDLVVLKTMISATIEAFIRTDVLIKGEIAYHEALENLIAIIMEGITVDK